VAVEKEVCFYCGAVPKVVSSVPSNGASELMEQGHDRVRVEERTYTFTTPESETDPIALRTEMDFKPPGEKAPEDAPWKFSMAKTGSRKPMSQFILIIIFFASAAFMGLIILLMG
jgi:hypothetical protein